jgi:hypothetical protein
MALRKAIATGYPPLEIPLTDTFTYGMTQDNSKEVDTTNGLTTKTFTARRTYLTGTAGLTFTIVLPAASAAIDGMLMTIMSTAGRILVSWTSTGATIPGIAGPNANAPITVQYNDSTKVWYKVN